jgi:hypothetical protein
MVMRPLSFVLDNHLEQTGTHLAQVGFASFGGIVRLAAGPADTRRAGTLFESGFDVGSKINA